jgi:hypothetical protein
VIASLLGLLLNSSFLNKLLVPILNRCTGQYVIPMDNPTFLISERFELLSAYLDGEVSATERQQVEAWLASDAELRQMHQQLLTLQHGLKVMPVTTPIPAEAVLSQVLKRVDRQPRLWRWGGLGAAAVVVVSFCAGILTEGRGGLWQTAQQAPVPTASLPVTAHSQAPDQPGLGNDAATIMIALERPPVAIPAVGSVPSVNRQSDTTPTTSF